MIRRAVTAEILMVVGTAFALAADFNGRWDTTFNTPNGDVQLVFNFKVDGAKLTGSVETPHGNVAIEEGKVDGENISFKTHAGDAENAEINYTGKISGDN